MNNYWLHRIAWEKQVSYPLLFDENILSIGWKEIAKKFPNIGNENISDLKDYGKCMKECYGVSSRGIVSLKNFIHFKKNDLIVVPTRNRDFAVCKILEDKSYIPSEMKQSIIAKYHLGTSKLDTDLGFFKKVKILIKCMLRNSVDKALEKRMKMRQTNANINDLEKSIDKIIENF